MTLDIARQVRPIRAETDLRRILRAIVRREISADAHIIDYTLRPCVYRSSHPMNEIEIELDSGQSVKVFFKDLSPATMSRENARPAELCDPLREIVVYEKILSGVDLGTPSYLGSVKRPSTGRFWMFLASGKGVPLSNASRFSSWVDAARWLARFHNWFAERPVPQASRLLCYTREYYAGWATRIRAMAELRSSDDRRRIHFVAERYEQSIDRLLALPTTMLHGEYYPANILVDESAEASRICPVDWELAGVGPGLIDLAALTSGDWDLSQRDQLVNAYRSESKIQFQQFDESLQLCRLYVAAQWLGWSVQWNPPTHQRYNWLDEAVRLAEETAR